MPIVLKPNHYSLRYDRIDFVNFTFSGSVEIECTSAGACEDTVVKLHAIELQFLKATLRKKTPGCSADEQPSPSYDAVEFRCNYKHQTCAIVFEEKKVIDEANADYVLSVEFSGILNDQMHGFYRSFYEGVDGKRHVMATTQFEATDARRAFPCFDEPALKASFQLTVTIPSNLTAISNTPMSSSHTNFVDGGGGGSGGMLRTVAFQKTPKMSTYLLALVVGQFDGISETSNHIVTTVYTVPGKASQGQFCLDTAVRCLDFYQELYGIGYPLTKSDLVSFLLFRLAHVRSLPVSSPPHALSFFAFPTTMLVPQRSLRYLILVPVRWKTGVALRTARRRSWSSRIRHPKRRGAASQGQFATNWPTSGKNCSKDASVDGAQ